MWKARTFIKITLTLRENLESLCNVEQANSYSIFLGITSAL